ncbi:MAG: M28 family peptidase [Fidelibacterota bacterium]
MTLRDLRLGPLIMAVWLTGFTPGEEPDISSRDILHHIKFLASDELEGRRAGTRGGRKASRYIMREFRSYGLKPTGGRYSFKSPFEFAAGVRLGRRNRLEVLTGEGTFKLELGKDFHPLGFSATGRTGGDVVFVGYGIESDGLNYHDYAGVDVEGKVVIVLRYTPDGTNPHGSFGKYSPLRYKAMEARERGAAAVVFVTGPADEDDEDYLMSVKYDRSFSGSGIPVVGLTQRWVKVLFNLASRNLQEVQGRINEEKLPHSFALPASMFLETSVEKVRRTTRNIVGLVKGTEPGFLDEYVVVGAHYDHLGLGGEGSLAPDTVAVHNGADDNASGTAGLLELAEWFSQNPQKRNLLFVAFGAEELGLLGSSDFVANPPVPLGKMVAMLNMDMIGRMKDSTLVVGGVGTSPIWGDLVGEKAGEFGLTAKFDEAGYGASDHQSFYLKGIPVLFLFTGIHEDYSRPSDDWQKINAAGEERVVKLARAILEDVANRETPPGFTKVEQAEPTRGGFPVYLGTIPDYSATDVEGMKLSGVREGGPADKGGLKGGDIIIKFGGKEVKNIYDFMYALQEAKADVPVIVAVRRGEEVVEMNVVPGRRRD